MRILRGIGGAVLWLLAALVGLLGALLSITVVLLPVGIPLLLLAGSMFRRSMALLLPRKVSHPVEQAGKTARREIRRVRKGKDIPGVSRRQVRKGKRKARRVTKRLGLSS
ncbi:MAG: hypothetical protein J2P14_16670 [Acidothermales bacterium]|nr:hypothetical protein [Acidothermales bacterium]